MDRMDKPHELVSNIMSELERAVHIERENLQEEIFRNKQEASPSKKRLKERADDQLVRNLLQTRE